MTFAGPHATYVVTARSIAVVQRADRMKPRELVGDRYTDALGLERIVPAATREAFIEALTVPESPAIAAPTRVLREGDPLTIDVTLAGGQWDDSVAVDGQRRPRDGQGRNGPAARLAGRPLRSTRRNDVRHASRHVSVYGVGRARIA